MLAYEKVLAGKRIVKKWVCLNLTLKELLKFLSYVKKSYKRIMQAQNKSYLYFQVYSLCHVSSADEKIASKMK